MVVERFAFHRDISVSDANGIGPTGVMPYPVRGANRDPDPYGIFRTIRIEISGFGTALAKNDETSLSATYSCAKAHDTAETDEMETDTKAVVTFVVLCLAVSGACLYLMAKPVQRENAKVREYLLSPHQPGPFDEAMAKSFGVSDLPRQTQGTPKSRRPMGQAVPGRSFQPPLRPVSRRGW